MEGRSWPCWVRLDALHAGGDHRRMVARLVWCRCTHPPSHRHSLCAPFTTYYSGQLLPSPTSGMRYMAHPQLGRWGCDQARRLINGSWICESDPRQGNRWGPLPIRRHAPKADFCLGSAHPAHSHLDVGLQNQRNTDRPTYGAPSPLAGTGKTARVQQKLLLVVKRRQHSPPSQVSYMSWEAPLIGLARPTRAPWYQASPWYAVAPAISSREVLSAYTLRGRCNEQSGYSSPTRLKAEMRPRGSFVCHALAASGQSAAPHSSDLSNQVDRDRFRMPSSDKIRGRILCWGSQKWPGPVASRDMPKTCAWAVSALLFDSAGSTDRTGQRRGSISVGGGRRGRGAAGDLVVASFDPPGLCRFPGRRRASSAALCDPGYPRDAFCSRRLSGGEVALADAAGRKQIRTLAGCCTAHSKSARMIRFWRADRWSTKSYQPWLAQAPTHCCHLAGD